jgi:transmembrane sensor
MSEPNSKFAPEDPTEAVAARWIARRDRGLSATEQAAFQQWLDEDPRHSAAMRRPEKNWRALDQLARHFPVAGTVPDPALLAPPRRRFRLFWLPALAAAAAVAWFFFARPSTGSETVTYSNPGPSGSQPAIVQLEPVRQVLADGSIVELNTHATVTVQYTPTERRIRLVGGEAYFIVAKNRQRPFLVRAGQVTVRAVGTAFSVGLGRTELSVLVTEGKVRVDEAPATANKTPAPPRELSALHAGQQGVFALTPPANSTRRAPVMEVKGLTATEVDLALSWRNLQLEFTDLPLGEVVAEFNHHNRQKLAVADAETAALRVGGLFRADNIAAFVSLLDSLGVSATEHDGQITLTKAHGR